MSLAEKLLIETKKASSPPNENEVVNCIRSHEGSCTLVSENGCLESEAKIIAYAIETSTHVQNVDKTLNNLIDELSRRISSHIATSELKIIFHTSDKNILKKLLHICELTDKLNANVEIEILDVNKEQSVLLVGEIKFDI